MPKGSGSNSNSTAGGWTSTQAYIMAVVCLLIGIAVGYFVRGSAGPAGSPVATASSAPAPGGQAPQQLTPQQLKQMADQQVAPLLQQLKSSPNDPVLLANIGNAYYDAQQYKEAIEYYGRSLQFDPKNPNVRTDYGTAYFYTGDPDRAISEFNTSLKYDPKHGQTLFNLGMVKWQGKADAKGAVEAWEQLLRTVPDYPEKAKVQELITRAKQHTNIPAGTKTDKPATM
jgi:cytochrome c-type biogenesis protein CcmH/NrfG